MSNDIIYSLSISYKTYPAQDIPSSNGIFKSSEVLLPFENESIASFSDNYIIKQCSVDYFSLLKYYSSGIHFTKASDNFSKIIDMNMIRCLYKNILCPYFNRRNSFIFNK